MLPDRHSVIAAHDQFILLCTNSKTPPAGEIHTLDYQRLYNTLFLLCRDLAFSLARRVLYFRKVGVSSDRDG